MTWQERLMIWLAWHLPRKLVYWSTIRLITHAYGRGYSMASMGSLDLHEMLDAWEEQ